MTVGLANPKHTALASRVPCQGVAVKRRKRSSQINNSKFGVVRTSLSIRGMARKRFKKKKKKLRGFYFHSRSPFDSLVLWQTEQLIEIQLAC